jgi:hypothetical protein
MKTGRIREFKVKAELHVKKNSVDSPFLNAHSNQVFGYVMPCGLAFGWPPTAAAACSMPPAYGCIVGCRTEQLAAIGQRPESSTARRPRRHQSKPAIGSPRPSVQITTIITQVL